MCVVAVVALLQAADASQLDPTSDAALCMFLNLYHLMVLHATLVVGPPQSLLKWGSFFNCCAYLAFGDVFRCAPI